VILPRYFPGTSRAGLFFMVGIIVGIMIGLGEILVRYLVVTWSVPGRYLVGTWSLLVRYLVVTWSVAVLIAN
jgi:hypothetical protein